MEAVDWYGLLADVVLVVHLGIVVFVVAGLGLVVVGSRRGWSWTSALPFRLLHLAAIAVVVAQSWVGATCPLTALESWLRAKSGATAYTEGFIEHWVQWLLFYDAPTWVFTVAYTAFGWLVVAAWWYFPPRRTRRGGR